MEKVIEELKALNNKAGTIISLMAKPENKAAKIAELAATGIGILGILSIIDVIRNWIYGG